MDNVTNGLVLYPNVIRARIDQELPFSKPISLMVGAQLETNENQQWQPSPFS